MLKQQVPEAVKLPDAQQVSPDISSRELLWMHLQL